MSAQPLNSEISIHRALRGQRIRNGTDAIAVLIKRLRSLVLAVPGNEIGCGVLTRDTAAKDFSPYCGQAAAGATRGFPVVFGLLPTFSFSQAVAVIDNLDFPFCIGQDQFIKASPAALAGDLYGDVRAYEVGALGYNSTGAAF